MKKDNCINSVFNGITITIDMIEDNPYKIRLFALRSFGESFYHSITDACLDWENTERIILNANQSLLKLS